MIKLTNEQFNMIMSKLEEHDKRFEQIDKRFEQIDKRFEKIENRLDELEKIIDKKFAEIDKKFEQIDKKFEQIDKKFKELNQHILDLFTNIDEIVGKKVDTLEETCRSINQKYSALGNSDLVNKEMINNHEYRIKKIEDKIFENFVAEEKEDYIN